MIFLQRIHLKKSARLRIDTGGAPVRRVRPALFRYICVLLVTVFSPLSLFGCTPAQSVSPSLELSAASSSAALSSSATSDIAASESSTVSSAHHVSDFPDAELVLNAPSVTKDGVTSYDFSALAWQYLSEISTLFPNRNVTCELPPETLYPADSVGSLHDEAASYIYDKLLASGYEDLSAPELEDGKLPLNKVCNISARLKGADSSSQIIIGAHYDGTGAGDNASGTALLLATACGLKALCVTPPVDLVFIFFDAEENGLVGSTAYAEAMTAKELSSTLFMVNLDSLAFGDYCYMYGGRLDADKKTVIGLSAYERAARLAEVFNIKTCLTDELDGYFAAHGTGPALDDTTIFTNPWTDENPPPQNYQYPSPMTGPWSDHEAFSAKGIDILYFEASNMFAVGDGKNGCYSGYYETYDTGIGYYGMFMNTEYDTPENLETYFPGRAKSHLSLFSRLLTAFICSS